MEGVNATRLSSLGLVSKSLHQDRRRVESSSRRIGAGPRTAAGRVQADPSGRGLRRAGISIGRPSCAQVATFGGQRADGHGFPAAASLRWPIAQRCGFWLNGAAQESNLPRRGFHARTGFEDNSRLVAWSGLATLRASARARPFSLLQSVSERPYRALRPPRPGDLAFVDGRCVAETAFATKKGERCSGPESAQYGLSRRFADCREVAEGVADGGEVAKRSALSRVRPARSASELPCPNLLGVRAARAGGGSHVRPDRPF